MFLGATVIEKSLGDNPCSTRTLNLFKCAINTVVFSTLQPVSSSLTIYVRFRHKTGTLASDGFGSGRDADFIDVSSALRPIENAIVKFRMMCLMLITGETCSFRIYPLTDLNLFKLGFKGKVMARRWSELYWYKIQIRAVLTTVGRVVLE